MCPTSTACYGKWDGQNVTRRDKWRLAAVCKPSSHGDTLVVWKLDRLGRGQRHFGRQIPIPNGWQNRMDSAQEAYFERIRHHIQRPGFRPLKATN
jgi:hypothetical protein